MKSILVSLCMCLTVVGAAQNHSEKPIRFIFESIHDHLGNLDINSKRVQLFSQDHRLIYEADLYDGTELDEQFFYYDDKGKLMRDHRIFHETHESGDYRMIYDPRGNLIEEINLNDIGEIIERKKMTYDDRGNILTKKVEFLHHENNQMITEDYFEYKYENGKLVSKSGFEGEKEDELVTYKYEISGNAEITKRFNAKDIIQESWKKEYNDKGWLVLDEHTLYENGASPVTKSVVLTYDEYGHLLEETMTKSNSQVQMQIVFEYVYDEYGNWIERKETKKKGAKIEPGNHLKRYIEYYEHDDYDHSPMELDETYTYETRDGKQVRQFQETHVRINNNEGQIEWVVRRNKKDLYQIDEYEYEHGKLVLINHLINAHESNPHTVITYNDKGQKAEMIAYSATDKVKEKTVYSYDSKGNIVKEEVFIPAAGQSTLALKSTEEMTWNSDGKLSKLVSTEAGVVETTEYSYDEKGDLLTVVFSSTDKDVSPMTHKYTYKGKFIASKSSFEGKSSTPHNVVEYACDLDGEITKEAHFRADKVHMEIHYIYLR